MNDRKQLYCTECDRHIPGRPRWKEKNPYCWNEYCINGIAYETMDEALERDGSQYGAFDGWKDDLGF